MITACESVCRDFGWLFSWLSDFATNPVWALFFGFWISLFIWRRQTNLSAELELRREKRSLYRDFIAQVGKGVFAKDTEDTTPWHFHPDVRRIWALQAEIVLIGSGQLDKKTKVVLDALEARFNYPDNCVKCTDGVSRSADDAVRFELEQVILHLKADIGEE